MQSAVRVTLFADLNRSNTGASNFLCKSSFAVEEGLAALGKLLLIVLDWPRIVDAVPGRGDLGENGSCSIRKGYSDSVTQGSEPNGRRYPMGESPGIKYILSSRNTHDPVFHLVSDRFDS